MSDRANHRLEYLRFDRRTPDGLAYDHTVDLRPSMGGGTLPCNLRVYPAQQGRGISPALDGPVAVLDSHSSVARRPPWLRPLPTPPGQWPRPCPPLPTPPGA